MKKCFLLFLATALLLCLTACGKDENPTQSIPDETVSATQPSGVFPTEAKILTSIPAFNDYKAEFACANSVLYVSLTSLKTNQQNMIQLTLPAVIQESILDTEGVFLMADMDFDGDYDIGLLSNIQGNNRQYYCFLWNAQTQSLTFNTQLSALFSPSFDKMTKTVNAVITENTTQKNIPYQWKNQILTQIDTEPATEEATTVKITAEDVADAVWYLFAISIDKIKNAGTDSVDSAAVTVFEVPTNDGNVYLAVDADGNIYIDENRDGNYRFVEVYDSKYYIGASVDSGYDSADYEEFAMNIAAMEVGDENIVSAQRNGSDYINGRLVMLYNVSINANTGSITVAFDDTMCCFYILTDSGEYIIPEEKTTQQEITEPSEAATEDPTTEDLEIVLPDEVE